MPLDSLISISTISFKPSGTVGQLSLGYVTVSIYCCLSMTVLCYREVSGKCPLVIVGFSAYFRVSIMVLSGKCRVWITCQLSIDEVSTELGLMKVERGSTFP